MMESLAWGRATLLGAVVAIGALAASTGPALAATLTTAPVWSPPAAVTAAGDDADFSAVTCPSAGNCVGVGAETVNGPGIVAAETGGTWGTASVVEPTDLPGNASTSTSELWSVACASATSCMAVGEYSTTSDGTQAYVIPIALSGQTVALGQATEVTLPTGFKAGSDQDAALNGISCQHSGSCVVVGTYLDGSGDTQAMVATPSAGAWTATEVTELPTAGTSAAASDPNAALNSVSCPTSSACEAVGEYVDSDNDEQPLLVPITDGTPGQGAEVSMPTSYSPSGYAANSLVYDAGTELDSISCPTSASACVASGQYSVSASFVAPVVVPVVDGTARTATELSDTANDLDSQATAISCADTDDCSVAGEGVYQSGGSGTPYTQPLTATEIAGTWSSLTAAAAQNDVYESFTGLSCVAAERCAGVGLDLNTNSSASLEPISAFSAPVVATTTRSLPAATAGRSYTATLAAIGGTGSYTWSISSGSLPAGLTLNQATGVISGTPTVSGDTSFTAEVTDAGPPTQKKTDPLSIDVALPAPKVSLAYLSVSGEKLTAVLSCAGSKCAGKTKLSAVEHLTGKTVTEVVAGLRAGTAKKKKKAKKTTRKVTLASGKYSIAAGKTETIKLTLSKSAQKLLSHLHKLSAQFSVTPTGATKASITKTTKFTSKAKKKPKKASR